MGWFDEKSSSTHYTNSGSGKERIVTYTEGKDMFGDRATYIETSTIDWSDPCGFKKDARDEAVREYCAKKQEEKAAEKRTKRFEVITKGSSDSYDDYPYWWIYNHFPKERDMIGNAYDDRYEEVSERESLKVLHKFEKDFRKLVHSGASTFKLVSYCSGVQPKCAPYEIEEEKEQSAVPYCERDWYLEAHKEAAAKEKVKPQEIQRADPYSGRPKSKHGDKGLWQRAYEFLFGAEEEPTPAKRKKAKPKNAETDSEERLNAVYSRRREEKESKQAAPKEQFIGYVEREEPQAPQKKDVGKRIDIEALMNGKPCVSKIDHAAPEKIELSDEDFPKVGYAQPRVSILSRRISDYKTWKEKAEWAAEYLRVNPEDTDDCKFRTRRLCKLVVITYKKQLRKQASVG